MRLFTGVFLLSAMAIGAPAFADTISYKRAKVTIDIPEDWKSSTTSDQVQLQDEKDEVEIAFVVVDNGAIDKALDSAGKFLASKIKKLTWGDASKVTINGMRGVQVTGDGRLNGTDIDLMVMVLDTPADDKDLLIIAIGEDAKLAKHKNDVIYVFQHLKPKK